MQFQQGYFIWCNHSEFTKYADSFQVTQIKRRSFSFPTYRISRQVGVFSVVGVHIYSPVFTIAFHLFKLNCVHSIVHTNCMR